MHGVKGPNAYIERATTSVLGFELGSEFSYIKIVFVGYVLGDALGSYHLQWYWFGNHLRTHLFATTVIVVSRLHYYDAIIIGLRCLISIFKSRSLPPHSCL